MTFAIQEGRHRVFEDGRQLGPPHTPHDFIRGDGRGQFSHWESTLYFSGSDNSDPRANGRTYRFVTGATLSPGFLGAWAIGVLALAGLSLWLRRTGRAAADAPRAWRLALTTSIAVASRPAGAVFDRARRQGLDGPESGAVSSLDHVVRRIARGRVAGRSAGCRVRLRFDPGDPGTLGRPPDAGESALHRRGLARAGLAHSLSPSSVHRFRDRPAPPPALRGPRRFLLLRDSAVASIRSGALGLPSST